MSIELVKETIKINQVIGEELTQTIIENDIIVPDIKPDVSRILLLDADTSVDSTDVMQDKISINGNILYKILYVSDEADQSIKCINTNSKFSYGLDVANARHGMKGKVKCDIEHIDYNILNGRKINVKAIVRINAKVNEETEQDFVNDLAGIDNVQILRSRVNVDNYIGGSEAECLVKEYLEIPAGKPTVKEILRNDIKLTGKDYKITDNKIIAKGELNVLTLYTADDEDQSVQFVEHEIPFTQFIDLNGLTEDARCDVEYAIIDSQFEMAEDSDGELRALNAQIALNISAVGIEERNIEIIEDSYSPHCRVDLEKKSFKIAGVVNNSKSQITVKDSVVINDEKPEIVQVFNVLCKPILTENRITENGLEIEGIIKSNVLYLANNAEQPIFCYEHETPFRQSLDIEGISPEMECDVGLDIEHYNYSMVSANEVEVRASVAINTKVIEQNSVPLVVNVDESPVDEKRIAAQPSITIYFSQPGDTLWKIAKKYYTTIDDIRKLNNIANDEYIIPGRQVIIPKRVS